MSEHKLTVIPEPEKAEPESDCLETSMSTLHILKVDSCSLHLTLEMQAPQMPDSAGEEAASRSFPERQISCWCSRFPHTVDSPGTGNTVHPRYLRRPHSVPDGTGLTV